MACRDSGLDSRFARSTEPIDKPPDKGNGRSPRHEVEQPAIDEEADVSERWRVATEESDIAAADEELAAEHREERRKGRRTP